MIAPNITATELDLNSMTDEMGLWRLAKLGRMSEGYFRAGMDYTIAEDNKATAKELKKLDKQQEKLHHAILDFIYEEDDEEPDEEQAATA